MSATLKSEGGSVVVRIPVARKPLRQGSKIYFILCQATGRVKCGVAVDPRARLGDLQVGSPTPLKLIAEIDGDHRKENAIHHRLDRWHIHGEWFHFVPEVCEIIVHEVSLHLKALYLGESVVRTFAVLWRKRHRGRKVIRRTALAVIVLSSTHMAGRANASYGEIFGIELAKSQLIEIGCTNVLDAQRYIGNAPRNGGKYGVVPHRSAHNNRICVGLNDLFKRKMVCGRTEYPSRGNWSSQSHCLYDGEGWLAIWETPSHARDIKNAGGPQSWRFAVVSPRETNTYVSYIPGLPQTTHVEMSVSNICPQFLLGSSFSALHQTAGCQIKSDSRKEQQSGEPRHERVSDFESIAKKRRPELGSLLFAVLCLGLAFPAAAFASDSWHSGRRVVGGAVFCIVALMGLQSTIGVLLGIDGWSIWRMLQ